MKRHERGFVLLVVALAAFVLQSVSQNDSKHKRGNLVKGEEDPSCQSYRRRHPPPSFPSLPFRNWSNTFNQT